MVLLLSPCLLAAAATIFLTSSLRTYRDLPEEWKHHLRPAGMRHV